MLTTEQLAEIQARLERFGPEYGDVLDLLAHIKELETTLVQSINQTDAVTVVAQAAIDDLTKREALDRAGEEG